MQVADYGVPQFWRRFALLGGLGFEIVLPNATHSHVPGDDLAHWRTVRDAIENMTEPLTLAETKAVGHIERSDWHIVRKLSCKNVERIKAAKAGETWTRILEHLRPDCHRDGYVDFTNVHGRMEWDSPPPTIADGCTTFSKGRFDHPDADRTISVREAALLYPTHSRTRNSLWDMIVNLSVTVSRHFFHSCGIRRRKKSKMASTKWLKLAGNLLWVTSRCMTAHNLSIALRWGA